jgi:hypothetical protein
MSEMKKPAAWPLSGAEVPTEVPAASHLVSIIKLTYWRLLTFLFGNSGVNKLRIVKRFNLFSIIYILNN